MAAEFWLSKPKPVEDREVRQEKPTTEKEGGGTRDERTKAKEGGSEGEGPLKTGDQE